MRTAAMMSMICVCLIAAWADEPAAPGKVLWSIGVADKSAAEFALAPDGYKNYQDDALFIVGRSDPAKDWPYVLPGPADAWAQHRAHTNHVLFTLKTAPTEGACVLKFSIVDNHATAAPHLLIRINNTEYDHRLPKGNGDDALHGDFAKGKQEPYDLSFPAKDLKPGENDIAITNESGSWLIFDALQLEVPAGAELGEPVKTSLHFAKVDAPQAVIDTKYGLRQLVRAGVLRVGTPVSAKLRLGDVVVKTKLVAGEQTLEIPTPQVKKATTLKLVLEADGKRIETDVKLQPVRNWTVYLMHHTHLDIGYTHVQTDVEKKQWEHIDKALELAKASEDNPPEARFKWLPEGLWAVDSYLRNATPEKRQQFIDAVKAGSIGLDALYGNELTALCRPEELLELTGCARRLARDYGLKIDSAMISDVPGYTWGIVPALAQSGVKYFSIGPNAGHRIGNTLSAWGDKPFYWVGPDGETKVLCWVVAKAYSWFHSGKLDEENKLLDYLGELQEKQFPYDFVHVRYSIGGDNGPPDPGLPDFVKRWNDKYAYPKLVIATTSEAFRDFEAKYHDVLPKVSGDFTPYWEDGAASSARETSINRGAAERVVQAQTLWTMLKPGACPQDAFDAAWRNVLLYDEHTWGSWNSISDPECAFTLGQWKIKQAFAIDADQQSRELVTQALGGAAWIDAGMALHDVDAPAVPALARVPAVRVLNTCSWPRTDLVVLPSEWKLPGDLVIGPDKKAVPSQRLSRGQLAFLAHDVPPFGYAVYTLSTETPDGSGHVKIKEKSLSNGAITVKLNETTGAIESLKRKGVHEELVGPGGLNDYFYVAGRDPKEPQHPSDVHIGIKEQGPLYSALTVTSKAPGCRQLIREIRIISELERVDIVDVLDKEKVYQPEAVLLAFPFNVPRAIARIDTPLAVVRADADQIPGACKNYFTASRWGDVSNEDYGVTCAVADAPLIEIGAIATDARPFGWLTETKQPRGTFYSYVMNNYWETNYKASQDGLTSFRYSLHPHRGYKAYVAERFGIERSQPLLVAPAPEDSPKQSSLLRISPQGVIATVFKPSQDGKAALLRLFNAAEQREKVTLEWRDPAPKSVCWSGLDESEGIEVSGAFEMRPWQIVTLRVVWP